MKKISFALIALLASGMASAVQFTTSGNLTTANCLAAGGTSLLNEDVKINLTNGVVAGVACDDVRIAISACHSSGRKASRSANVTTCTDPKDPATCTTKTETVTGPAMAYASTLRGTTDTGYPSGDCTAAAAETFAGTK